MRRLRTTNVLLVVALWTAAMAQLAPPPSSTGTAHTPRFGTSFEGTLATIELAGEPHAAEQPKPVIAARRVRPAPRISPLPAEPLPAEPRAADAAMPVALRSPLPRPARPLVSRAKFGRGSYSFMRVVIWMR